MLQLPGRRPLLLVGMGGSFFYGGDRHQYTERQMRRRLAALQLRLLWERRARGRPVDVLMTHAPPAGIHEGEDCAHRGFRSFRRFVDRHQPAYHVHGHVHPTYGVDVEPVHVGRTEIRTIYGYSILEISA